MLYISVGYEQVRCADDFSTSRLYRRIARWNADVLLYSGMTYSM